MFSTSMDSQKLTLWQCLETIQEDDEHSGSHNEHSGSHNEHSGSHNEHSGSHNEHSGSHNEHSGSHTSGEDEQDAEMTESEESVGLEEEVEQSFERVEEESEEPEEEVQTPPSVRPKKSLSSLPRATPRVYNHNDDSQLKVRKKKRRGSKVKLQEELFPDWVVQLMFNIEEATQHELVME